MPSENGGKKTSALDNITSEFSYCTHNANELMAGGKLEPPEFMLDAVEAARWTFYLPLNTIKITGMSIFFSISPSQLCTFLFNTAASSHVQNCFGVSFVGINFQNVYINTAYRYWPMSLAASDRRLPLTLVQNGISGIFRGGHFTQRRTHQYYSFQLIPLLCTCPNKYVYIMNIHPSDFFATFFSFVGLQRNNNAMKKDAQKHAARTKEKSTKFKCYSLFFRSLAVVRFILNYSLDGLIARFK